MEDIDYFNFYLSLFPNITVDSFIITSPLTKGYNCIAWAYGEDKKWFWPGSKDVHWPENIPNTVEVNSFIELYRSIGYEICDDESYEEGFLKVAIYTNNTGKPQHAARQINKSFWTSKLGEGHDVSHTIPSLNNGFYGNATVFMKRAVKKK